MKKLLMVCLLLLVQHINAQFLLEEDFNFSGNVSDSNGWVHLGGTSNFMQTNSPGLMFPNYPGTGIGNAVSIRGVAGEDVYKTFSSQTQLYYSFLIRVAQADSTIKTGYVTFLGKEQNTGVNGSLNGNYFARIAIQTLGDGTWKIGTSNWALTNTDYPPIYSTSVFENNQTYAVIIAFDMASNYKISIWVKENYFPLTESAAGSPDVIFSNAPNTAALPMYVDAIGLRQDATSPNILMDGLRIFKSWSPSVVPLKLLSFQGKIKNTQDALLEWKVAQSVNVKYFEVQTSKDGKSFVRIGVVPCMNKEKEENYYFTDYFIPDPISYYRIKIVDFDEQFVYSSIISIQPNSNHLVKVGTLGNKSIKVFFPSGMDARNIKVLDFNGTIRKTIPILSGNTSIEVNMPELITGIYILQIFSETSTISQKFLLQ